MQEGALPVPRNDSRGNLNPDANVYAPRIDAGEVSLNVTEIGPVNEKGAGYVGTVLRAMQRKSQTLKHNQENTLHI
jgi:hypothetical protein